MQRLGRKPSMAAIVACTVLTSVGLVATADEARAESYTCYAGGRGSRSFNVRYEAVSDTWAGVFDNARSRWNGSGAGASIGLYSGSTAIMTAGRYDASWYGLYTPRTVNFVQTFTIQVNWPRIQSDAPSASFWNWVRSTTTHELGHSLRLNDNPATASSSLMKYSRDRGSIISPQPYDVANVQACY